MDVNTMVERAEVEVIRANPGLDEYALRPLLAEARHKALSEFPARQAAEELELAREDYRRRFLAAGGQESEFGKVWAEKRVALIEQRAEHGREAARVSQVTFFKGAL
jgi:hypothetical protein